MGEGEFDGASPEGDIKVSKGVNRGMRVWQLGIQSRGVYAATVICPESLGWLVPSRGVEDETKRHRADDPASCIALARACGF